MPQTREAPHFLRDTSSAATLSLGSFGPRPLPHPSTATMAESSRAKTPAKGIKCFNKNESTEMPYGTDGGGMDFSGAISGIGPPPGTASGGSRPGTTAGGSRPGTSVSGSRPGTGKAAIPWDDRRSFSPRDICRRLAPRNRNGRTVQGHKKTHCGKAASRRVATRKPTTAGGLCPGTIAAGSRPGTVRPQSRAAPTGNSWTAAAKKYESTTPPYGTDNTSDPDRLDAAGRDSLEIEIGHLSMAGTNDIGNQAYSDQLEENKRDMAAARLRNRWAGRRGACVCVSVCMCKSTTQRTHVTLIEGTSPSGRPTHTRVTDAEETTTSTLMVHASPHQAHVVFLAF
ncbi:hypothetical protein FOA52_008772 [Chlamydomonas sp. UWO 241]|nr:hypothetical protein FOA52_008772 [Chlamydomonas sp. UWO 241]